MSGDALKRWLDLGLANAVPIAKTQDQIWEYLAPVDRDRFARIYCRLYRLVTAKIANGTKKGVTKERDNQARRNNLVGRLYERLLRTLFDSGGVLSCKQTITDLTNVQSLTNEIDLLLKVGPTVGMVPIPPLHTESHVLVEAKCHRDPPSSALVQEIAGTCTTHGTKFAILFVFPTQRKVAAACRKALHDHSLLKTFVVTLGRLQLDRIAMGAPLLSVLQDQYIATTSQTPLFI